MFLYKADDYSKVGEFGNPAHGGGVYAVSLCCKFINLKTLCLNLCNIQLGICKFFKPRK